MQRITGLLITGLLLSAGRGQEVRGSVDVAEGEDAVLRCRFDPAEVDPAEASFYWSHRNSREWDNVAIQEKPFRKRYRIDFVPSEGRYDLHISAAAYERDNGQFACRARRSGSGQDLHAETFQLTVLLRPEPPQLQPPERLAEGAPAQLSCSSRGGSPPPELRWYRHGSSAPLPAELSLAEHRAEPTVSRLTLPLTREDDGAELECVVWNRAMEAGERLSATVKLSVDYYPRVTVGPSNPLRVEAGRAVQMRCEVDAKPSVANVRWMRSGAFINTNFVHRIDVVEPADTGVYTCSAENAVGERAAELRLDVLYGPRVTTEPEREMEVGGSAQVKCEVDANPPVEEVYWLREGDEEFRQSGAMLRLSRVAAGDGGSFVCVAVNRVRSVGMSSAEQRVGNATTRVLVRHAPGAAAISPDAPVGVEGRPLTLTCTASPPGHPPPRYRWWRKERPDTPFGFGQNFTVGSVLPRHAGQYLCQPENELGEGAPAAAEVRVLRAPQLATRLQPEVKRPVAAAAFAATCSAQGRPRPAVAWLKDGEELQTADGRYDVTIDETERKDGAFAVRSTLNFRGWARKGDKLEPADRGNYTCRFENAAGTAETTMLLRIRHAPIVYHQYNKVAFDVGEEAAIACQMQAYPAPVFRWTRRGAARSAASTLTNTSTSTSQLGNDVHQSVLRLARVSTADYGEYVCQAQNAEGEHSTVLRLQAKGRPEPPTGVHAAELGTSWALLDWTPGFDGGFKRTIHHVTLLDERDKERAFDCQMRRPCNVTSLQHRTTYRLRIRANNTKGDSAVSEQVQFTTMLDVSQLPAPQRAQFSGDGRQLSFHVLSSPIDVVGTLDVRSGEGEWRRSEQQVSVTNNRGLAQLDAALGDVTDVRVRLCLRDDPSVCGQPVLAERMPAGATIAAAGGSQMTTIILVAVGAIAAVAVLVLLFICCCRRSGAAKTKAGYTEASYNRQKLPAYYPPAAGVQNKSVSDAADLSHLAVDPAKTLFAGSPPRGATVGPPAAYEPSYSNSNSNTGGSVNSQDSLWQAKEGRSYPHEPPTAGYDPAAAGYDLGYGDYGAYPPQEAYPAPSAAYPHDEYGREAEHYGAAAPVHGRQPPHDAGYRGVSGMPDPYAGHPEPENKPQISFDESLESGYSTPNTRTRRVIREIIV